MLGSRWDILKNIYKPHPAGIVFHAAIDACLELRALAGDTVKVTRVIVEGPQVLLARGDRPVGNDRVARVSITALPTGAARVVIEILSGRTFTSAVMHANGSLERPMSDSVIEGKVRSCAHESGFAGDIGKLTIAVWNLDKIVNCTTLPALAIAGGTSA